jgi:hypothetical protein
MDSMRSLNTSLPSTSTSRRQASHRSEALLQAFKEAALSVTNLYKTSASLETDAYREGYQDALQDLLSYMDKGDLGLQDGEGWGIRKWATERYQRSGATIPPSESEDEVDEEQRPRSSSPTIQRKQTNDIPLSTPAAATSSPVRSESAPPVVTTILPESGAKESIASATVPQAEFSFRTTHQYPSVHDIDMDNPDAHNASNQGTTPTVQVNLIPRPSRISRSGHNARSNNRSSNTFQLGPGAGLKRRLPTMDFFDIGNLNGKDAFGGGKRGRFS